MTDKLAKTEEQAPSFAQIVQAGATNLAGFTAENQFRFRFPREGKIHLGVKQMSQSGKEYPTATDYLVLPEHLAADEPFREALTAIGEDPDKPKRIPVWLPSSVITDNITSSYDRYSKSRGLLCRSVDGVTARCANETTGEIAEIPCLNAKCPHFVAGECVVMHRLRVMLPDASGVGVWQIDTKSPNNWATLSSEMTSILSFTGGKLAGLDLFLTLEPEQKQITVTEKKTGQQKTMAKDVYLLHLRSAYRLRDLRKAAAEAQVDWDMSEVEEVDTDYDEVVVGPHAPEDFEVGPEEPEPSTVEAEAREELLDACCDLMRETGLKTPVMQRAFITGVLKVQVELKDCTVDQLTILEEKLTARAAEQTDPQE